MLSAAILVSSRLQHEQVFIREGEGGKAQTTEGDPSKEPPGPNSAAAKGKRRKSSLTELLEDVGMHKEGDIVDNSKNSPPDGTPTASKAEKYEPLIQDRATDEELDEILKDEPKYL